MPDPAKPNRTGWAFTAVLLLLAGGLVVLFSWAFFRGLRTHPEIVVSVAAVLAGFGGNIWVQRRTEREKLNERRREAFAPLAENLFKFIREIAKRDEDEITSRDATAVARDEQRITDIQDGIMLWGSREMVATWADAMRTMGANETSNEVAFRLLVELLHALRVELGHNDSGLAKRDLARLFFTDPDPMLQPEDTF
jgi:hypothetical protein